MADSGTPPARVHVPDPAAATFDTFRLPKYSPVLIAAGN